MGVICACLPTFGPIIARQFPLTRIATAIRGYLLSTLSFRCRGQRSGAPSQESLGNNGDPFARLSDIAGGNKTPAEHIHTGDLEAQNERLDSETGIVVSSDFEVGYSRE